MIKAHLSSVDKVVKVGDEHLLDQPRLGDGQHRGEANVVAVHFAVLLQPDHLHLWACSKEVDDVAKEEPGGRAGNALSGPVALPVADVADVQKMVKMSKLLVNILK